MLRFLLLPSFLLSTLFLQGQIIVNGYAKVTSIAGSVLSVNNVNETNDSFEDGEFIVIMQMQDDVIGANTADAVTFGNLSAIGSAGLYEIRRISTHTESAGLPTTITVLGSLVNTYNTSANASVQIISLRSLGSPNYSTTSGITGLAWNGNIGGVVAIEVTGTLTLNHTISANAIGFRGGAVSANYYDGTTNCIPSPYRTSSTNQAFKGEGIYKSTDVNYTNGQAKILTGGGGANHINGGGGGGGNYTAGGAGGTGWNGGAGCPAGSSVGGYGGIALSASVAVNRVFMGGGGGGGQQNNSVGTAGANGGGIVLIKAGTIQTTGSCSVSPAITANGGNAATSGNDGAGGGGAAGSIVLQVNSYSISGGGCALTIAANGGNGGSVNTSTHAGGGAGAQGLVVFSGAQPTTNTTTTTNNGNPGCSNNSVPCNTPAGSATGSNNSGILINLSGPLPIELLNFNAVLNGEKVDLTWTTAAEINNDYFTVERSKTGEQWEEVLQVDGAGNSNQTINYFDFDAQPYKGVSYYRLKQTDHDGGFTYSNVVVVKNGGPAVSVNPFPNPTDGHSFNIELAGFDNMDILVIVRDIQGKQYYSKVHVLADGQSIAAIDLQNKLPAGTYLVIASSIETIVSQKIVVR